MKRRCAGLLILFMFLAGLTWPRASLAREIVDMSGRRVEVPETIHKVFASSPPSLYLIYAMDPGRLAGITFPFNEMEKPFLRQEALDLPVIGGWFGQGHTPNMENVLLVKPDIMLVWMYREAATNEVMENAARTLGIPLVYVKCDTIEDYADTFLFLGNLLGLEKRGRALSEYTRRVLARIKPVVDSIPEERRVRVYYAEGVDGLRTECSESTHALLIPMAGGRNIHQCQEQSSFGMVKISLEQVMLGAPDVLLAQDRGFHAQVYGQPQWGDVKAVGDRRVHLIPRAPFNWFDRPPSFMRILGVQWLTNLLYPERYPLDLPAATREFYSLFLGRDLTDAELQTVLHE